MMVSRRRAGSGQPGAWDGQGRKGSFLAEVAMSGVMLVIAMGLTVKVLGWVGAERRAWDRRQWAAQEAANLMERLTAHPFDKLTPESAKRVTLSPQAKRWLPGAELNVDVVTNGPGGGEGSKRIAIRLRWRDRSGNWDAPLRLTSWIYDWRPGR